MTRWPTWFESSVWYDAERAGDDGDRDHRGGGDRQLGRVVLADRLQHAPEQEGGEDAEARREDDQRQDGAQPQLVRREQAADAAEIGSAKGRVGGTLSGGLGGVEEHPHGERVTTCLTLYQTEWCPFSSAVREVLTELGLSFVARQVEPWPEERDELRALAGTEQIPVLQAEDGTLLPRDARDLRPPARTVCLAARGGHRHRFHDHRDARETDVPGQLIEYFRGTDELEAGAGSVRTTRSSSTSPSRTGTSCGSTGA